MNSFIASFNELLAAQNEALGRAMELSINGVTTQFIYEVPTTGQTLLPGAFSEDGTSWVQCLASPFADSPITFQSTAIVDGTKMQVVNTPASNHGIYRFQVGDPTRK